MIFKILFSLLFCLSAFAFDKDFKTVNDRVPLEFSYLFDSLKNNLKSPAEKLRLVGIAKELDENLGTLQKEHIFLLMKSEVIKNVLEYKHQKVRSFDMTTLVLARIEQSFREKEKYLTPFAQWIFRSVLAELNYRKNLGIISSNSFSPALFEGPKRIEADRFARYLNYLLPWVDKMDSLEPEGFNQLTKEVSWVVLRRLNERSLLFKRFASTSASDTKITLFNIPSKLLELHPEDIKRMQTESVTLTLKEESEKQKTEAKKQIENATPDDLSTISDEVSKELDKKVP